jgi:hypothetical protein
MAVRLDVLGETHIKRRRETEGLAPLHYHRAVRIHEAAWCACVEDEQVRQEGHAHVP